MKKILSVLLVVVMCCGMLAGCSSGNSDELSELKKENTELKKEISELKKSETEDTKKEEKSKEKLDVQEMKLNEPFTVNTEYGTYSITFQAARLTDWWGKSNNGDTSKTEIALTYEVENIDFKTGQTDYSGRDGVLLDSSAFKVSDENGYVLNMDNGTFSEYGYPEMLEPGYKTKEELPYIVDGSTSYVDVVLYRSTGDVGKIRINVTQ